MAIIKCKMCGGDLNVREDATVCECEYCGTKQTVPKVDDEKKLTLFARAGRLLRACEFDKAAGVFETIVADFPDEAEAYWGLVLCKYGIEYVDDPATGKKIPTCHRSSFDSVMKDANFEQACENTDAVARRVYRDEARAIEELRKSIIEVSDKEEPYDVFISYKEKDANGERTKDSVIAQEIYRELTREGYRVFFSRISLEDKLGVEYEPYIFAALNSARVMIVVGTDYENFDAVWVKNEWSRYLKLIAKGERKTLIPVFRDMDAYDMPEEFNKLTALDMGKVGAVQDLVHGVEKVVGKKKEIAKGPISETVVVQQGGGPNVAALLKRGQQALEDEAWEKAGGFFEQVLNMDAENADAFFGLFLAERKSTDESEYIGHVCSYLGEQQVFTLPEAKERIAEAAKANSVKNYLSEDELRGMFRYDLSYSAFTRENCQVYAEQQMRMLESDRNFIRARQFAKGETVARLNQFAANFRSRLDIVITEADQQEKGAREAKRKAYDSFLAEAEKRAEEKCRQAEEKRETDYQAALQCFDQSEGKDEYLRAKDIFLKMLEYKDCAAMAKRCDREIARIDKEDAEEKERQSLLAAKLAKEKEDKQKKKIAIIAAITIGILAIIIVLTSVVIPSNKYKTAVMLYDNKQYEEAIPLLFGLPKSYKNVSEYQDQITLDIVKSLCVGTWESFHMYNKNNAASKHSVDIKITFNNDGTCHRQYFDYYYQDNRTAGWDSKDLPYSIIINGGKACVKVGEESFDLVLRYTPSISVVGFEEYSRK